MIARGEAHDTIGASGPASSYRRKVHALRGARRTCPGAAPARTKSQRSGRVQLSSLYRATNQRKPCALGQRISPRKTNRNRGGVLPGQETGLPGLRNKPPCRAKAGSKDVGRHSQITEHFLCQDRRSRSSCRLGEIDRVHAVDHGLGNDQEGFVVTGRLDQASSVEQTSGNRRLKRWRAIENLRDSATANVEQGSTQRTVLGDKRRTHHGAE